MKWLAPAKINLSLRVLGRRADGFHEIETLMVPLDLADEVTVAETPEHPPGHVELVCSDPTLPVDEGNLAFRAAALFRDRVVPGSSAVRVDLTKRVPHGAGLGGGSSDAASVLLALDALRGTRLTTAALAALAAELGSDIPFFVYRSAAWCRGRGERVEPAAFRAALPLLLIKPAFPISTPWAYDHWRDSRELPGVSHSPQSFPWGQMVNDLERPVFEKYFVLAEMKTWLLEQPEAAGAMLSGSGSTMIALLKGGPSGAEGLTQRVRAQFGDLWTLPCMTLANP